MNINQLIARLIEVRDQNAASWPERNDLPMVVAVEPAVRMKGQRRRNSRYFTLQYASSAMHGLPVNTPEFSKRNALVLVTSEGAEIIPAAGFPTVVSSPEVTGPVAVNARGQASLTPGQVEELAANRRQPWTKPATVGTC
jgi:hypothetical protein